MMLDSTTKPNIKEEKTNGTKKNRNQKFKKTQKRRGR